MLIWQLLDFSILGVISWPPPWEDMDLGLFPHPPMYLQYTSLPSQLMSWFWVDPQAHGIYAFVNAVHSCHVVCDDYFSSLFNPTFPRVGNCCVLSLSLLNPHQFIPRYYPQLCKSPFNRIKQVWHTVLPAHLLADISPRALDLLHSGLATVEDAARLSPPNYCALSWGVSSHPKDSSWLSKSPTS